MYTPPEARSVNDLRRWGDVSNWIVEEVANEDEEKGGEDTGRLLAVLLSSPWANKGALSPEGDAD